MITVKYFKPISTSKIFSFRLLKLKLSSISLKENIIIIIEMTEITFLKVTFLHLVESKSRVDKFIPVAINSSKFGNELINFKEEKLKIILEIN
jgi:hypothetical protein